MPSAYRAWGTRVFLALVAIRCALARPPRRRRPAGQRVRRAARHDRGGKPARGRQRVGAGPGRHRLVALSDSSSPMSISSREPTTASRSMATSEPRRPTPRPTFPSGESRVKLRGRGVLPSHLARERGCPLGERLRDLLLGAQLVVRRGVSTDRPGRRVDAQGRDGRRDGLPRQRHLRRPAPRSRLVAERPVERARAEGTQRRGLRVGLRGDRPSARMVGARGMELSPVLGSVHPHRQPWRRPGLRRLLQLEDALRGGRASTTADRDWTVAGETGWGPTELFFPGGQLPGGPARQLPPRVATPAGAGERRPASTTSPTASPTGKP